MGRLESGGIVFQLDYYPTTRLLDAYDPSVHAEPDPFGFKQVLQR
jgi:hypothetical protein